MKHSYAIITVILGCLLASCHSNDVNFDNIDPKAQINMGLVVPVGTLNVSLGDFLGTNNIAPIYVDEHHVFHIKASFDIPPKNYHAINMKDYIIENTRTLEFKIADVLSIPFITGDGITSVEIPFPLELDMDGINEQLTDERIDSIWITQAIFNSWIKVHDFDLRWHEIKNVKLYLDSTQFRRNSMIVDIPISDKGFGQKLDINVNDFTLNLLKDSKNPSAGTVNKIKFKIAFEVCPDNGHVITINPTSEIRYDMGVELIDYDAIWGFFEAGSQMSSRDVICLKDVWEPWDDFKKLKLRFAAPKIDVYVAHHVSAPLIMHIDYIRAVDTMGNESYAKWAGDTETDLHLKEYMSPLTETLNDSVEHHETFSNNSYEGQIDELFEIRPDSFLYSFYLKVDQNKWKDAPWTTWKQLRILKNTRVTGHADLDVPFQFKENSEFSISTIIDSINISSFTLDSLFASAKMNASVNDATIKLFLTVSNSIPFEIQGTFNFLDEKGEDTGIMLGDSITGNTITFPAPKMSPPDTKDGYGIVTEPSVTNIIIDVDKSDFDNLAKVKKIQVNAAIQNNPERCSIKDDSGLSVQIGLAAQVDAIFNFANTGNNNNNNH